jgi:hypothetical protein
MKQPGWDGDRALHELLFDLVRRGRFDVDHLNTHTFAPADCVAAYDFATQRRGDTMGVLLRLDSGTVSSSLLLDESPAGSVAFPPPEEGRSRAQNNRSPSPSIA